MGINTYTPTAALIAACDTLDLIYSYIWDDSFEGSEQVLPDLLKEAADLLEVARPGMAPECHSEGLRLLDSYSRQIASSR